MLINQMDTLGLSCSYEQVKEVKNTLTLSMCKQYEVDEDVYPLIITTKEGIIHCWSYRQSGP